MSVPNGGQGKRHLTPGAKRLSDGQRLTVIFEGLPVFSELVPTIAEAMERYALKTRVSQIAGYRERLRVKLDKAPKVLLPFLDCRAINQSLHFIATFAQLTPSPQRVLVYCRGLCQQIRLSAPQQLRRLRKFSFGLHELRVTRRGRAPVFDPNRVFCARRLGVGGADYQLVGAICIGYQRETLRIGRGVIVDFRRPPAIRVKQNKDGVHGGLLDDYARELAGCERQQVNVLFISADLPFERRSRGQNVLRPL